MPKARRASGSKDPQGSASVQPVQPFQDVKEVIEEAGDWLLANRNADGGWGERKGTSSSTLNTAEAVLALFQGPKTPAVSRAVKRGIDFLLRHQIEEGDFNGAWSRVAGTTQIPDIVRTCFCTQALIKDGWSYQDPALKRALDWLSKLQAPDGGWAFSPRGKSALVPSILALLVLVELYEAGDRRFKHQIERGLAFVKLSGHHFPDGSFSENPTLTLAHTIYAALLLQAVWRCGLDSDAKKLESRAVHWLIANVRDAGKVLEETFPIDNITEGRTGDYGFRYMTDALLLQVFSDSIDASHRQGEHVDRTLTSLSTRLSPEGGFYGNRTTSWATARAIVGLASTKRVDFPPPSQSPPLALILRGGSVLLLAVLTIAAMVYMTILSKFGVLQMGLLAFMMLSVLLALNVLTGGEFRQLVIAGLQSLFGGGKKPDEGEKPSSPPGTPNQE